MPEDQPEEALFTVVVEENSAFMDADERYAAGRFEKLDDAIRECRRIVDADLREQWQRGMTVSDLLARWRMWGRDSFIPGDDFSAWSYAAEIAPAIVAALAVRE